MRSRAPPAANSVLPVRRQRSDRRPRFGDGRQLGIEAGSRGVERRRRPLPGREVHQVHARPIAGIDGGMRSGEERRQPRAHQVDALGCRVSSGDSCANFRICGPVNRSNAREPVSCASSRGPPSAASISPHCRVVLESIQIGDVAREKTSDTCGASGREASSAAIREPRLRVEVDAAMLLRRSRDGAQLPPIDALLARQHPRRCDRGLRTT